MDTPKKLIDDIVAAGKSQRDISKETELCESAVSELRSNKREGIGWGRMVSLMAYHKYVMRWARKQKRKVQS